MTTLERPKAYRRQRVSLNVESHVEDVVKNILDKSNGTTDNLYHVVLSEMERPLIEATMKFTGHNQSRAASILGLNRGTFRKKLAFYGML